MSTYRVARQWHHVDARGLVCGRLASRVSHLLQGKHKPTYEPWADSGDCVVVTHVTRLVLSGRKWQQKVYKYHTGWVGGLKEVPVQRTLERKPEEILQKAVFGMLPRNKLRELRMGRLHCFGEGEIPHDLLLKLAQNRGHLPPHVAKEIEEEAMWKEEVYDPEIHKGYIMDIEETDASFNFEERPSTGTKKFRKRHIRTPRMFKPEDVHFHSWDRKEWDALVAQGMTPDQIKESLQRPVDPRKFRQARRWLT